MIREENMLTEEQKKIRKFGIGGSDAGAIMGVSPWKTARELWFEKQPDYDHKIRDDKETDLMEAGNALEPAVINMFRRHTKLTVSTPQETFYSKEYPFMFAHLDGLVENGNILEAKAVTTPYMARRWGEEGTNQIPAEYLMQVAHYCMVMDRPVADIAAFIVGEFKMYRYVRNPELEKEYIQKAKDFWYMVQNNIMPPASDYKEALDEYREQLETAIANNETMRLIEEIREKQGFIKQHEARIDELKKLVLEAMGTAAVLNSEDGKKLAQVIISNRNNLNLEKLKKIVPNLSDFYEPKQIKSFRIF